MTLDDLIEEFRKHPTTREGVKRIVEALRPTMIGLVRDGNAGLDEDFCVDHALKKIIGEVKP